jgi:acetylornithine deacetylase/succinyl-diaminopimelate desuccinylase-like protein
MNMKLLLAGVGALALAVPVSAEPLSPEPLSQWHQEGRGLFEQAVNIPTVEGRGEVKNLVALLKDQFEAVGLNGITVKDHNDTQTMILRWKAVGKPKQKPILLMAHMDVVEALPADWSFDPFVFREENGYYYGRGTNDNKAGMLAITMTLLRLKKEGFQPKRDIIVLFTGDEETVGKGAELATTQWRDLVDAEYALNSDAGGGGFLADGTPLGFGIQAAEKTYRSYTFSVTNPGGHSSRPRPDNAIYELAGALKRLEAHRFTPMLNEVTKAYFTERAKSDKGPLGDAMRRWVANPDDGAAADVIEADPTEVGTTRTRCVATKLSGGHADNALPQLATATVNCRILPGIKPEAVEAELRTLAGPGVTVTMSDAFGQPTDASPLRKDVVGAYTRAVHKRHPGVPIIPNMSTGATDGAYFRAIGIPVYGVGGEWIVVPEDERAHGRDERLPVKAFHENMDIWYDMVSELAG